MTDELKPCAHCNHDAKFVREIQMSPESPVLGYILCPNCGMRTGCMLLYSDAIAAWNIRHESPEIPEWVKEEIDNIIQSIFDVMSTNPQGYVRNCELLSKVQILQHIYSLRKPEEK